MYSHQQRYKTYVHLVLPHYRGAHELNVALQLGQGVTASKEHNSHQGSFLTLGSPSSSVYFPLSGKALGPTFEGLN